MNFVEQSHLNRWEKYWIQKLNSNICVSRRKWHKIFSWFNFLGLMRKKRIDWIIDWSLSFDFCCVVRKWVRESVVWYLSTYNSTTRLFPYSRQRQHYKSRCSTRLCSFFLLFVGSSLSLCAIGCNKKWRDFV